MQAWWGNLSGVTQLFYGMATFFSVFFLWQIAASFLGLSGDEMSLGDSVDDPTGAADHPDVVEASQAFRVLSLRSIITFFTLFSWACALYTTGGRSVIQAMGIGAAWGIAGMLAIAGIFYAMGKLTETGTTNIASCKGQPGIVYLNIPASGVGEIKIEVNGTFYHLKAQSANGTAIPAGTPVRVVQIMDSTLVKVEKQTEQGE